MDINGAQTNQKAGKNAIPKMEFDTIDEIADDYHASHEIQAFYLIALKTEVIKKYRRPLKDRGDIKRYRMSYPDNQNSILPKGMQKHKNLAHDYYVHIARKFETEFSEDYQIYRIAASQPWRICVMSQFMWLPGKNRTASEFYWNIYMIYRKKAITAALRESSEFC